MRRLRALSILAAIAAIVAGTLPTQSASASARGRFWQIGCYGTNPGICLNWGGYSVNFINPDPQNDPLGASAIWTVPGINCSQNGTPITNTLAEWVGLGGTTQSNPLEQTGTAEQSSAPTARRAGGRGTSSPAAPARPSA